MSPKHLMSRIEETYRADLERAAKKYAPTGTDWKDVYQEILVAVYERARRRRVPLRDEVKMRNTITQRAIDQSRKALRYRTRFNQVGAVDESARSSAEPIQISETAREKELKARIRRRLPALDARIVIELAFPSSAARTLARKQPTQAGPKRMKVDTRLTPTVRHWHVARFFGVSRKRVTAAMKSASKIIGTVIEEEEDGMTTCQICSRKRECRLVRCNTKSQHREGVKLTGKKGSAMLSVCSECAEEKGVAK